MVKKIALDCVIFVSFLFFLASTARAGLTGSVNIQNSQFVPQSIQVAAGSTVTWVNNDSITHTATADDLNALEVWDSGSIASGQSFSRTFTKPGTYFYHCSIHPGMKGIIQVVQAVGGSAPVITPTPTPTTQQLPRTGTPAISYLLPLLIPAGYKLIKFQMGIEEDKSPLSLWKKRKFRSAIK